MRRIVLVGLVTTLLAVVVCAQGPPESAQGPPEFVVRGSLKGADVPEFYRYQTMFHFAHVALEDPDPQFHKYYLKEILGIPPGGEAETVLQKAVEDAWTLLTGNQRPDVTMNFSEDSNAFTVTTKGSPFATPHREDFQSDEAFDAEIRRRERVQAHDLGRLVGQLEADLQSTGISLALFHHYVDETLADSMSLIASDDLGPDHQLWQIEQNFEAGRQATRHTGGVR